MEETHWARYGVRVWSSCHHAVRAPPSQHLLGWYDQPRNSPNPVGEVFTETSLHKHDWLDHWWQVISSTSRLCPLPVGRGWGWKFQPSNHMVVLPPTSLHAEALEEPPAVSHSVSVQKDPYHLGDSKDFRSNVPGKGEDCMYISYCVLYVLCTWRTYVQIIYVYTWWVNLK